MSTELFQKIPQGHDGMLFKDEDQWYLKAKIQPKTRKRNPKPTQLELPMSNITMRPVQSSQIEAIGHDPETNTLAIKFKSGGTYHYANFTTAEMDKFDAAESVGSYFHKHIKPNKEKFPFTKQA